MLIRCNLGECEDVLDIENDDFVGVLELIRFMDIVFLVYIVFLKNIIWLLIFKILYDIYIKCGFLDFF